MKNEADFWNGVAEKYARAPIGDMAAYDYTLSRSRSYLGARDRVLELGCGTGSTALLLAPDVGRITGTDVAAEMIRIARRKVAAQGAGNVEFEVAAADRLPDGPFDAVLAYNLLHLLRDPVAVIGLIHGALRPGGVFISKTVCLAEPGQGPLRWVFPVLIPALQAIVKAPFVHRWDVATLERMVTDAGFEIVEAGNFPARQIGNDRVRCTASLHDPNHDTREIGTDHIGRQAEPAQRTHRVWAGIADTSVSVQAHHALASLADACLHRPEPRDGPARVS